MTTGLFKCFVLAHPDQALLEATKQTGFLRKVRILQTAELNSPETGNSQYARRDDLLNTEHFLMKAPSAVSQAKNGRRGDFPPSARLASPPGNGEVLKLSLKTPQHTMHIYI